MQPIYTASYIKYTLKSLTHLSNDIIGQIRRAKHLGGLQDRYFARVLGITAQKQIAKITRLRLRYAHLFHCVVL